MTVEEIELRKILTQMLADNGINKNTILAFTKEIISEKVDRAVKQAVAETNIDGIVSSVIKNSVRSEVQSAVSQKVNSRFDRIKVDVNIVDINGEE